MTGGLLNSPRKLHHSVLGLTQNRAELFAIELQEERSRFVGLFFWLAATLFLSIMTAIAVTATVLLSIPNADPARGGSFLFRPLSHWSHRCRCDGLLQITRDNASFLCHG